MKKKENTWFVIADGTRARILTESEGRFTAALNQQFVGENLKSREVLADKPARVFDRFGGGRHATDPPDPHREAKAHFAVELAKTLESALSQHQFETLVLIAPPQMLGDLRAALSEQVRKRVAGELDKDFTQVPEHQLPDVLAQFLSREHPG